MRKATTKPDFKPDFKVDDDVLVDVGPDKTRAAWCIGIVPCAVLRWYTKNRNYRKGCAYVPIEKVRKVEKVKAKKGART